MGLDTHPVEFDPFHRATVKTRTIVVDCKPAHGHPTDHDRPRTRLDLRAIGVVLGHRPCHSDDLDCWFHGCES